MSDRPSSRDFEVRLVLAIIHDSRFRDYFVGQVPSDVFSEFDCQYIYETIQGMIWKKKPIKFFSVYETIRRDTSLSDEAAEARCSLLKPFLTIGGNSEILESVVDGVLPIAEDMVKRRLVELALIKTMDLFEQERPDDAIEIWSRVGRQAIYRIPNKISVWDALRECKGDVKGTIKYRLGIPTGICGLDKSSHTEYLDQYLFFKGIGRGHLAILLGDSNIGKSTVLLNIAIFQSLSGYNVDLYSLEVDKEYLVVRMISILTGIATDDVVKEGYSKKVVRELEAVEERYPQIKNFNIHHYPQNTLTAGMLEHDLLINEQEGKRTDVLAIDYLDLMASEKAYKERRHEIGNIAIALRNVGDEFGCAVMSPSQMNRGTFADKKKGKDRRNISEDFSKVFTCDDLWDLTEEIQVVQEINKPAGEREILRFFVDKNRFGKRGMTLTMLPDKATGRFYNVFPKVVK